MGGSPYFAFQESMFHPNDVRYGVNSREYNCFHEKDSQ
jgi:hypothetical protein